MFKTRMKALILAIATAVSLLFLLTSMATAEPVTVVPKTDHSALTMSTDGSYGYQVMSGNPLRLELVGPGKLAITVRLNHSQKWAAYQGQFEIRRKNRRIRKAMLKLFRSRVGSYKENASIFLSTPKIFNLKVPPGSQNYTFSLRAARGISMTIGIGYDTDADQSAVLEDDDLALVPLVAMGGTEPPDDDIGLVPLAPIGAPDEKKPEDEIKVAKIDEPAEPAKSPEPIKAPEPVKAPEPAKAPEPVETKVAEEKTTPEPVEERPTEEPVRKVETIEETPAEPPSIEQPAPQVAVSFMSVGAKLGQISPLQGIGATSFTVALDLRYVLPVFDGRLTLGIEAGYHQYSGVLHQSTTETTLDITVVPISLQLFYRIPLGMFIEPFIGVGGDLFLSWAEVGYANDPGSATSGSAVGFGGHVSAGAEAKLGPGYLLVEVRAGISNVDFDDVVSNVNVSGLSTVAGYRFEF